MRFLVIILLTLFISIPSISAQTVTVSGTEITSTYTEPSTNSDNPPTPLTDLSHTTIYIQPENGDGFTVTVPATSPTGGGTITEKIIVPVGPNAETNVDVWMTASDLTGNESVDSIVATIRIDRLAPAGIQ